MNRSAMRQPILIERDFYIDGTVEVSSYIFDTTVTAPAVMVVHAPETSVFCRLTGEITCARSVRIAAEICRTEAALQSADAAMEFGSASRWQC